MTRHFPLGLVALGGCAIRVRYGDESWMPNLFPFVVAFVLLRPPAKAVWLLLPGRWGRAERLLWRYSSWRQRLRLYTCHSIVVKTAHGDFRLSRAWWRLPSCVHFRYRGRWRQWFWRSYCYDGVTRWMPRADVLLAMKLRAEAYGFPMRGGVPFW